MSGVDSITNYYKIIIQYLNEVFSKYNTALFENTLIINTSIVIHLFKK